MFKKNTPNLFSDNPFTVMFIFDYIGELSLIFWYLVNISEAYNVGIWCQEGYIDRKSRCVWLKISVKKLELKILRYIEDIGQLV
jgi:hypothetical protein